MFGNFNNNNYNNNGGFGIFRAIAEKANKTTNSETAKKIRKNLLTWGASGAVLGIILIIIGMITFISTSMSASFELPVGGIVTGFVLFFIGGILITTGVAAFGAGLKIVIVGVGADILDTSEKCPKCGDAVTADEAFCDKCGTPLFKKTLCDCGKQNDLNSVYCKSCGKRLR